MMLFNKLVILILTPKYSSLRINQYSRKSNHRQRTFSYIAPNIWNSLPDSLGLNTNDLDTYKDKIKKNFLDRMKNKESNIYSCF